MSAIPIAEIERLAARERVALSREILGVYLRMRVLLLRRGMRRTVDALRETAAPPAGVDDRVALLRAVRLGHATVRVLRVLPTDGRCLMRSLVLTALLARRGIPSRLVIGVDPGPGFAAHAWVEHRGTPVLDPGSNFHRLMEI